ncbi:hypothetical protein CDL12_28055 [Handroanthus impetiginosus]|uniref:Uncharacterized protein n=1 Tax=Handroanthus impetiginosus TaxID=429701 RepID=A0A2G9G2T2_9LAMI|nr:hypothetical protein CDL12_28055 [Handroanthus impetiginosus]
MQVAKDMPSAIRMNGGGEPAPQAVYKKVRLLVSGNAVVYQYNDFILKENQSAVYVYCFAHQLQLALVAVAKKQLEIASLFNLVATLTNVVGASCKRCDILREKHANVIRKGLGSGKISSGRNLNQEITLKSTLLRLVSMFSFVVEEVLGFCEKYEVAIPNMDENFIAPGHSRRKLSQVSNLHHFQVEIFYQVIDWQLKELNDRFLEIKTELLICVACLSPRDSFSSFDKKKLVQLAKLYLRDFSFVELLALDAQLENYILDMRSDSDFDKLRTIGELSKNLVKKRKHIVYPLVYLLVNLALILPMATATVERTFSAMNIIKISRRILLFGLGVGPTIVELDRDAAGDEIHDLLFRLHGTRH